MPLRTFRIDTAEKELRKHLTARFNELQVGRVIHRPAVVDKKGGTPESFEVDFTGVEKKRGQKVKGTLIHKPAIGVMSLAYGPVPSVIPAAPPPVTSSGKPPRKISFDFKL